MAKAIELKTAVQEVRVDRLKWWRVRGRVSPALNGPDVRINACFYADTRRGVVRSFVRTGDGRALLHPNGREVLKLERRGRVRVYVGRAGA